MPKAALDEALIAKIKGVQIRARHLVDDVFAGQYESAFKGRGMEFDEVREYFPGDDIRHIDWNVTARMNRPFLKVHRDERELTVMFLVDVSASALFGSGEKLKNEVSAELAALLAYTALRNNDMVGLIAFSDHVEHFLPPKKGRGHVWQVIRDILSYEGKQGRTDLAAPLDFLSRVLKKRAVVFLISDFQGVTLPKQLRVASSRHDVVALSVRDPRERELPRAGLVELEDAETGERRLIDTNSERVRAEFARLAAEETAARRDFFLASGIDHVEIDPTVSYLEPIVRFFRKREKLK